MNKIYFSCLFLLLVFSCSDPTQTKEIIDVPGPPGKINIEFAVHHNHNFTTFWTQCGDLDFKEYRLYMAKSSNMSDQILAFSSEEVTDTLAVIPNISYYSFYYFQLNIIDNAGNLVKSDIYEANSYPVILFVSDRTGGQNIFLVDYFGKHLRQLTHEGSYNAWPRFDIYGSKFVFETTRDEDFEIYSFDLMDFQVFNLTNNPGKDFDPCFTVDGERIIFISDRTGNNNVFRVKLDGSYQSQVSYQREDVKWPATSPTSYDYVVTTKEKIYLSNIGTSVPIELTQLPSDLGSADYSPDGKEIGITSSQLEIWQTTLYFIDLNDGSIEIVDDAHSPTYNPVYPLVYFKDDRGDIVEKDMESGVIRSLIPNISGFVTTISSDGETLILMNNYDIYRANRDGNDLVELASDPSRNTSGRIQPMP